VKPPPGRLVWTQSVVRVGYCAAARVVAPPWTTSRSSRLAVGSGGRSKGCKDTVVLKLDCAVGVVVAGARAVGDEEDARSVVWCGR
jgi:hypothetical protein